MNLDEILIRIKQARDKANLSARELSLRLGKNSSYITKLEAKEFEPSMKIVLEIIETCGISPEEFFYYDMTKYSKDKQIFDYFTKLTDRQKQAILNLYDSGKQ